MAEEPEPLQRARPRRVVEEDTRSRRQRFLDEQDLDDNLDEPQEDDEDIELPVLRPAKTKTKAYANPCKDVDEEPEPVSRSQDEPPEEELNQGLRPSNPIPKFTQILGRENITIGTSYQGFEKVDGNQEVAVSSQPLPVTGPVSCLEPKPVLSPDVLRGKAMQAMRDGLSDTAIALRFEVDVATVLGIRRDYVKMSKANNPREMFSKRINDLDDAFEVARENFFENPASEIHFRAMTEFNRSLRETIDAFQKLEDPTARSAELIKRVIRPLLMDQLRTSAETMTRFKDDIVKFVPEHVKRIVEAGVLDHVRKMSTTTIRHYNKSIATLEDMYGLDLSQYKQHQGTEIVETESQTDE